MKKTRIMPKGHWDWTMPVSFSQGWRVGNLIFVGGQISADEKGKVIAPYDIEAQTRNVFENVRKVLRDAGADTKDIVKLNTYYVDDSKGEASREFWEKMTRVRMKYFPDPGPAATAVKVSGLAYDGLVIEVEAIAVLPDKGVQRTRIMPKGHWDWSMPVSFSQGWKVGNIVYTGGQISADAQGRPIAPYDIEAQTRNVFESIRKVLREAGGDMKDLVKLNTYYVDDSKGEASREFWNKMTRVRMKYLADPGPVGTGVKVAGLAYDGLVIEVDGFAVLPGKGVEKTRIMPRGHWDWPIPVTFSQGWKAGNTIFVGGQVSMRGKGQVIAPYDIETQTRNTFENIRTILRQAGADTKDIVRLNTFYAGDVKGESSQDFWEKMTRVRMEYLPEPGPAATGVRIPMLALEGLMIEVEAIAMVKG